MKKLNFKLWLEIGDNYGLEPPRQSPEGLNNGAFPRYTDEPLPGNKKAMKKKMKKGQSYS